MVVGFINHILAYVSRYIVPFSYTNRETAQNLINAKLEGLPKDARFVERPFWGEGNAEMDTYAYLQHLFLGEGSSLGLSLCLQTNGQPFKLIYTPQNNAFSCTALGVILFKNQTGFVWYEIAFKDPVVREEDYIRFQHDFKELARKNDTFVKKTGKDSVEPFCLGEWLSALLSAEENGISFFAERSWKNALVPDKALMFQYVFLAEADSIERAKCAFYVANGYDKKYEAPGYVDCYEPFDNVTLHISRSGCAYVAASNMITADNFFMQNFPERFRRDYFLSYLLLLYQSYTSASLERSLALLPMEPKLEDLDDMDEKIDLFLVKGIYGSISSIEHQNEAYLYGLKRLRIKESLDGLTIGLDALKGLEEDKREKLEERASKVKDERMNNAVTVFGLLVIASAGIDSMSLIDYLAENTVGWVHIVVLFVILFFTMYLLLTLIRNRREK